MDAHIIECLNARLCGMDASIVEYPVSTALYMHTWNNANVIPYKWKHYPMRNTEYNFKEFVTKHAQHENSIYTLQQKKLCMVKNCYIFQPWQIAHWNKLFMKFRVILQVVNQIWNLQKTFFVFSEVAGNWPASIKITKSVPRVSSMCINHHWAYSPHVTHAWKSCRVIHTCMRSLLSRC